MIVHMSHTEAILAQMLGVMRNLAARTNGVVDKQMGTQDPIEIDRDGVLSEMAVAKHLNLWPDLSIRSEKVLSDLIGRKGDRIDVKSTRYKTGRLLIHRDKKVDDVDVYILAIVDVNDVDLFGFISSKDAIQEKNLDDLGRGLTYVIPQTMLTKFKD
jgi:hypothetical protein